MKNLELKTAEGRIIVCPPVGYQYNQRKAIVKTQRKQQAIVERYQAILDEVTAERDKKVAALKIKKNPTEAEQAEYQKKLTKIYLDAGVEINYINRDSEIEQIAFTLECTKELIDVSAMSDEDKQLVLSDIEGEFWGKQDINDIKAFTESFR